MKRTRTRYIIKIAVPVVLLTIVFSKIDLGIVLANLREVDLVLCAGALAVGYFSNVFLSTLRWKIILSAFYQIRIPYSYLLRYFWEGIFLGYFVPGGVGSDIYRVVNAVRHAGGYERNIAAVIGEKLLVLAGNVLLLIVTYPLVLPITAADPRIEDIIKYAYLVGLVGGACAATVFICLRVKWGRTALSILRRKVYTGIKTAMEKTGVSRKWDPDEAVVTSLVKPFVRGRNLALVVGFTFLIRVVCGGVGGWIMLRAVGVNLPIVVHVFVFTLIFLIFTLPISIGTLGIREGTFIVLFGLFGVEGETALAASFVGLGCLMVTTITGGIILLANNIRRKTR